MNNEIKDLIEKFNVIKSKGVIKSIRGGTTGIGHLFETSLGKKEDQSPLPDYKGIEIKTKIGFSKSDITLFTLVPKINNESAINYLLNNFGYPLKEYKNFKALRATINCYNNSLVANRFIFKVKVEDNFLKLYIYNKDFELISNDVYWEINDLQNRLEEKLKYLAIIKGYPYTVDGEKYYKYTSINIYQLRNSNLLVNLIKDDRISIILNIGTKTDSDHFGMIHDRGTAFKIKLNAIDDLFKKIY